MSECGVRLREATAQNNTANVLASNLYSTERILVIFILFLMHRIIVKKYEVISLN